MCPISGERTSHGLKAVRLFAVALTVMTLTACAQSSVVTNKSASLAVSQRVSLGFPHGNQHTAGSPDDRYGLASFYTEGSETASGEKLDRHELTAAHRTLPFGTRVRVTNLANGRSVTVRINDRGPFVRGRVVDVSYLAAERLGMTGEGIAKVRLDVVH